MRWSSTSRIRAGRLSPTESDVMPLRLTLAFSDNPRVQPLKDGLVKPQGIELDCITLDPSNLFQRNLTYDEFDVSEMSISETLLARERTDGKKWEWSALPVFLSRGHRRRPDSRRPLGRYADRRQPSPPEAAGRRWQGGRLRVLSKDRMLPGQPPRDRAEPHSQGTSVGSARALQGLSAIQGSGLRARLASPVGVPVLSGQGLRGAGREL